MTFPYDDFHKHMYVSPNEKISDVALCMHMNCYLMSLAKEKIPFSECEQVLIKMQELNMITRKTKTGKFKINKPKG